MEVGWRKFEMMSGGKRVQVTELKVMRRELEGSRREIEALRKSSADGGAAQKLSLIHI